MEHFVTLFDHAFLPQGMALHASLRLHCSESTLWILCMDQEVESALASMALPGVRLISLENVETQTPLLRDLKSVRSRAEYCWTLTPLTPRLVFEREVQVERVTYVDADVFFFDDPLRLLEGFGKSGKAVQITDHAYDPVYDQAALSGRFCVQFVTFVRDRSEPVRARWEAQCLEWCHATPDAGRYGDQKYLDVWPDLYPDLVHVMEDMSCMLAPWNARRYPLEGAVAWHFHGLRILQQNQVLLHSGYVIPDEVSQAIYQPYLICLKEQVARIGKPVVQGLRPVALKEHLRAFVRMWFRGRRAWDEQPRVVDWSELGSRP